MQLPGDIMLDHDQIEAPQFHEDVDAGCRAGSQARADLDPAAHSPLPMQAAEAAFYLGTMMCMPLQIAMAMPQVAVAQSRTSPILRHLEWQRSRERAQQ